jgi:hypothetical protein
LSAACLGIVLKESPEAKELYEEIMECYKLHGLQEIFDKLENEIPEGEELLKRIVDKSGLDYDKPPNMEQVGIPQVRNMIDGSLELISDYVDEYTPWVLEGKARNRDMNLLLIKITELIRAGFNNKRNQEKGIYKVSGKESYWLGLTIWISALIDKYRLMLKEWERARVLKIGGKVYNINDVFTDKVTNRIHRNLTRQYKSSGFILIHDQTLENLAQIWYQCRVVYSGPGEYCRKMLLEKGVTLDSANISNEIKICDEIIGYPRRTRKNN